MTPPVDTLKPAFDAALAEYLEAMAARKRALEAAMQSPDIQVHNTYRAATKTEEQKSIIYYEAARKLHEALMRR